jgi:hypothetical protein
MKKIKNYNWEFVGMIDGTSAYLLKDDDNIILYYYPATRMFSIHYDTSEIKDSAERFKKSSELPKQLKMTDLIDIRAKMFVYRMEEWNFQNNHFTMADLDYIIDWTKSFNRVSDLMNRK